VLIVVFMPTALGQLTAIAAGALAGLWWCRRIEVPADGQLVVPYSRRLGGLLTGLFLLLLLGLPAATALWPALALFEAFYRAGALVFGGGHVVLPLLET